MWHSEEIAKIFIKISSDYGYEVYSDRKKCAGLCGDLLMNFENEKNIFQMLFLAGFGETLKGIPFKTEEDLKMGLLRIEKFLQKQAIDQDVRGNIIEIVNLAFVDESIKSNENIFKPVIKSGFSGLHFKMVIPVLTEFGDRVSFKFQFINKSENDDVDTILEKCVIKDPFEVFHGSNMDYSYFPHNKTGKTEISVPYRNGKKIFISKSVMDFVFLCSNDAKVIVSYTTDSTHKLKFKQVAVYRMTESEKEKYQSIKEYLSQKGTKGETDPIIDDGNMGSEEMKPFYTSSDIKEYSDALRHEILFLKQGKGKKYKIVSGAKINEDRGVYTYTFDIESELHLPDDAPFVIDTAEGYHAVGKVLHCEDFQIMLLVDKYINDRVSSAYLMIEPWKLLESLDKRMTSLNPNINRLAIKVMEEGPKISTNQDISNVPMGQDKVLDLLRTNDIVTVWGPPGTGKTYTMAKIANEYLKAGKSVLIVSHSNVSVDGVVKKVVDTIDTNMQSYLKDGKILRFGFVRDEELSNHPYATSFNYALSRCPDYSRNLDNLNRERDSLRAKKQIHTAKYDQIEKSIKSLRDLIRKEERKYVEKAQLIATTISRATVDPMFEERQFDLVMFDEVSMAYVPQVIVAAALAKEKFMCVGDFRQLSPIAQNPDAKKVLQIDIFSYLKILDGANKMYYHPWLVMLNVQWRMHPDIAEFPNKYVYKNLLRNHPSVEHNRELIVNAKPLSGDALNLVNLHGTYCAAGKDSGNSRFNLLSAIISFSTAIEAEQNGMDSVGIITPYAAQTRLIRAMIHDYYGQGIGTVSCATVHQFQGSESDMLVFDPVESYPGNKVGFLMGKNPNEILRLINVAITRARGKIVTVANAKFWNDVFKGTNHIFYKFIQHNEEKHNVIDHKNKTLKPYIEEINPGRIINIYTNESEAIDAFEKDMERASGKVIISIPDGELRETESRMIDIIDDTHRRGVDILMKSNDYKTLPDTWKSYCYGTENAIFPLIVIDDATAWYGLPTAKLKFKIDKSTSTFTVVHTMVRIKGKNTIEMIKTLTELEWIVVGNNKHILTTKTGDKIKPDGEPIDDSLPYTLADFIKEKEHCSLCKSPMELKKNKKGTAYIGCSNKDCKHMEFLSKDLINWYITNKGVRCPRGDGGELTGGLGKYGPYVRCSRGHFLKPEEI